MHMGWRTIGSCSRGRSIADVQMTDASTEVVGSLKLTFFLFQDLLMLERSTTVQTYSVSRQCVSLCDVSFFLY